MSNDEIMTPEMYEATDALGNVVIVIIAGIAAFFYLDHSKPLMMTIGVSAFCLALGWSVSRFTRAFRMRRQKKGKLE